MNQSAAERVASLVQVLQQHPASEWAQLILRLVLDQTLKSTAQALVLRRELQSLRAQLALEQEQHDSAKLRLRDLNLKHCRLTEESCQFRRPCRRERILIFLEKSTQTQSCPIDQFSQTASQASPKATQTGEEPTVGLRPDRVGDVERMKLRIREKFMREVISSKRAVQRLRAQSSR